MWKTKENRFLFLDFSEGKKLTFVEPARYCFLLSILLLNIFFLSSSVKANVLLKYRYALLSGNEGKKLLINLQPSNAESSADGYVPYEQRTPTYIETKILANHEVIKFLSGSLLMVVGAYVGTIIAINNSNTSTKCGGDTCTSEGPSPEWILGGLLSGGVLGASAGVTLSGYLLHEDGNFFITLAGSIGLPFLIMFISDPSLSDVPQWAIEAAFPAMLVGAMAAYDLSRTHSNKKGVSLLYYPIVSVSRDAGHNINIAVNVLDMSF